MVSNLKKLKLFFYFFQEGCRGILNRFKLQCDLLLTYKQKDIYKLNFWLKH